MDDVILARVLHVLGVVLWIGGVAMVTTVLLPATRRLNTTAERAVFFETVESGFVRQARVTTLVTGLSGLYLVHKVNIPRQSRGPYVVSRSKRLERATNAARAL